MGNGTKGSMLDAKRLATRAILSAVLLIMPASGRAFNHPGILNSGQDLQFLKNKVLANQQPWKQAFDALKASKYSSLAATPRPFQTVICGSYNNPKIGCDEMVEDGVSAYSLALLWQLTGDRRYAEKAIDFLKAWTAKYEKNTESNARLVVSWAVPWFVNAAEILRYTSSGWGAGDIREFSLLLTEKLLPYTLDETMPGNNWIQSAIEAHMAIAIFTDNPALFDAAVTRWRFRVRTYIYQTSDGQEPVPSPGKTPGQMTDIWKGGSSGTAYVDGMGMETCRDLGHLMLGFKSMQYAAQSAWHQGVDVFGPEAKRIADFLELHARWMNGANQVPSEICGGTLLVNPQTELASQGGGGAALEIAYNQIHSRLGKNLPATWIMLQKHRPASAGLWVSKWETLTHGDLPFDGTQSGILEGWNRVRLDSKTNRPMLPFAGLLAGMGRLGGAWYHLDGRLNSPRNPQSKTLPDSRPSPATTK